MEASTWDAIVLTCQNRESANCFQNELRYHQQLGLIAPGTVLLAVDDPHPNIGSGSAVLNAVLCVSEHLAAQSGYKVVNADVIQDKKILILLLGSTFPFGSCGHGFMPHPQKIQSSENFASHMSYTIIEHLLVFLGKISANSPPGVWVSSTDMLLKYNPEELSAVDLSCMGDDGIAVFTVLATPAHAGRHGACSITENDEFSQIIYQGGEAMVQQCIRPDGLVTMLSGIAYFSPKVTAVLLSFHNITPLDSCTYIGLDNGAQPLSLSLFFDVLLCLTTEITYDDYITGNYISRTNRDILVENDITVPILQRARVKLWRLLKEYKMKAVPLLNVEHLYLRHVASDVLDRYQPDPQGPPVVINCPGSMLRGTEIGRRTVLIDCEIQKTLKIGSNCFLAGLNGNFFEDVPPESVIPDELAMQEFKVAIGETQSRSNLTVSTVYGVHDNLMAACNNPSATFCNMPWKDWFAQTGVESADLWFANIPSSKRTLMSARLFVVASTDHVNAIHTLFWLAGVTGDPDTLHQWRSSWRLSLAEILKCVNCDAELKRSRALFFESQLHKMEDVLRTNQPVCILPFFRQAMVYGLQERVLHVLDDVACQTDSPLKLCRVYACIADVLGMMAAGGMRAGPASNISFQKAYSLLENQEYKLATKALSAERSRWISDGSVDRLVRASRHYERAGQILTRHSVATAREFISGTQCDIPAINQEIVVSAPVRIDLAGAWTDTPPQAYEFGGLVSTMAIKLNDTQPVRAAVKRIPQCKLILLIGSGDNQERVECTELSHIADYSQPHAPGALLKTAFICAKIVDFPSAVSLAQQLKEKFNCGFQLMSEANVPQGSGMGTSSILGGVIMAALWRAVGMDHKPDSLIHAVLHLEQMLTTGGGWQDQCGGLYSGLKISWTEQKLPVNVQTRPLDYPAGFVEKLNSHLLLVYTGKTRLARNLLQDVLRNWHSRDAKIMQNMNDLIQNAKDSEAAIKAGDLAALGTCLNNAQKQKLVMAPGSLPHVVTHFIEKISHLLHGCCLCGAGGGGFLACITSKPNVSADVELILTSASEFSDFSLYKAEVDMEGIVYSTN